MSSAMMRMMLGFRSGCPIEQTGLSNASTAETNRPKVELDEILGLLKTSSIGSRSRAFSRNKMEHQ